MTILSNGHQWKYSEFTENKNYSFDKDQILKSISKNDIDDAYNSISKWEGYAPTPLLSLNKLSKELNLKKIFYKDENKRFNLKSFKALGGAYAVEKVTKGNKDIVVATATAGNHGRSVSWGAKRLGLKCKIFISEFVSEARGQAMSDLGADVIKVKGNYEKSLSECIKQSTENNWQIVQDVAWKDYMLIPKYTMAGYSVMMKEIKDQINNEKITHIILQAGVGGMAGAMVAGIARYLSNVPVTIVVEPDSAACVLESIKNGKILSIDLKKIEQELNDSIKITKSEFNKLKENKEKLLSDHILLEEKNNNLNLDHDSLKNNLKNIQELLNHTNEQNKIYSSC